MPNLQACGSQDFSKYDTMTIQQLQAFLREDASKPEGEGSDPAEVLYVLETLAARARAQGEGKCPQEAFATFQEHYDTENFFANAENKPRKAFLKQPWKRCVAAVLAAAVLIFVGSVTASALGTKLRKVAAQWTAGTFSFGYEEPSGGLDEINTTPPLPCPELEEVLSLFGVEDPMVPTWMPEGYMRERISVEEGFYLRMVSVRYSSEDGVIRLSINRMVDGHGMTIQQGGGLLELYTVNGVDYYIFQNYDTLISAWYADGYEYNIAGEISVEEMKEIINSIE